MFSSAVRLGRIGGAELSIGPGSVLFALFLAWSRGTAGDLGVLATIAIAVGFLVSIVVHELGHLVAARSVGIGVRAIRLDAIGGAAELERPPGTGPSEMLVAAGGPAANLVLGGASFALAGVLSGQAATVALWLALVNLVLGVFNLLPGLPFDGGHILVGFRWWRTGDKSKAIATAASVGRFLGYGLIGLGVVQFASGTGFGLWTAFIGWVVLQSARAQVRSERGLARLGDRTVGEVMGSSPALIELEATTQQAYQRLWNAPPDAPGVILIDDDGVACGFALAGQIRQQLDADPRRPVVELASPLDQGDVALPTEPLAGALGRGVGVPFVVIDHQWHPVGVVGVDALRAPAPPAAPPAGAPHVIAPPNSSDLG